MQDGEEHACKAGGNMEHASHACITGSSMHADGEEHACMHDGDGDWGGACMCLCCEV